MPGLVTSERAAKVYSFLSRSGPCPVQALEALYGPRARKAVKSLVGAGYARRARVRGVEYAALPNQAVGPECEVLGWFAVRLAQKGGFYDYQERRAYFPSRAVLPVEARGETVVVGDLAWDLEALKGKSLEEGARKNT